MLGRVVNRIDRNAAVPIVPPIWRKKVTDEVATPISRGETAFCTARMTGWKLKPRPRPSSTMNGTSVQNEVVASTTNDSDSQRRDDEHDADQRERPCTCRSCAMV